MNLERLVLVGMISAFFLTFGGLAVVAGVVATGGNQGLAAAGAATGFDEFGYNYTARVFSGKADGVDRVLDGAVWGDPTYANDHLVMKWSKAWDDARFHGAAWTTDAWEDNEWNGMVFGGSQTTEHAKIIWVGPQLQKSPNWRAGGYALWGQFEAIMDQGMDHGTRYSTHAIPTGYGGN